MPKYLFEASYTRQGVEGVRSQGGTGRRDAIAETAKSLGGQLESFSVEPDQAHLRFAVEDAELDQAAPEPREDLQRHRALHVVGHDPAAVHEAERVMIALRVDALAGDRHGAGRLARGGDRGAARAYYATARRMPHARAETAT